MSDDGHHVSLVSQVVTIAWRSIKRTLRQPAFVFPSIAFPLLLLTINSQGFKAIAGVPHFPPHTSYLAFLLAVPFMQSALFASTNAGGALAEDIEKGFLNRLALTPMHGSALVLGQLAGAVTVAGMAACCYVSAGLIAGVHFESGLLGVPALIVLSMLNALAFSGIGALLALRTGSGEAVQGMFPLLFVSFFLSSINMPRPAIKVDWFRTVATWNPVSYMIEGMRSVIITGWDAAAVSREVAVAVAVIALTLWLSASALRTRMVRT